jgi:hypothetical protein
MPILTARRVVALAAAAALTATRDSVRQLFAPDGVMTRLAETLVQASLTAYGVVSIAVWALGLWLAARRAGQGLARDIF